MTIQHPFIVVTKEHPITQFSGSHRSHLTTNWASHYHSDWVSTFSYKGNKRASTDSPYQHHHHAHCTHQSPWCIYCVSSQPPHRNLLTNIQPCRCQYHQPPNIPPNHSTTVPSSMLEHIEHGKLSQLPPTSHSTHVGDRICPLYCWWVQQCLQFWYFGRVRDKKSYSINWSINSESINNKHKRLIVWDTINHPSLNAPRQKEGSISRLSHKRTTTRHKKRQISQTNFKQEKSAIFEDILLNNTTLW